MHAIQRPGWLQVFRFSCEVKSSTNDEWREVFGVLRDDQRYDRTEIMIFDSADKRQTTLDDWSRGLIVRRADRTR